MIKRFCDKCKKEITNDAEQYGISFLDVDGKTKYVELCSVCHKDLTETNFDWLYNNDSLSYTSI